MTARDTYIVIPFAGEFLALTPAQLASARAVARELIQPGENVAPSNGDADTLLTAQQLEQRTGVPASWFLEQARRNQIPHRRLGKYPRFLWREVIECPRFIGRDSDAALSLGRHPQRSDTRIGHPVRAKNAQ